MIRNLARIVCATAALVLLCQNADAGETRPVVMAHYMAWFMAKPYSQIWGWHWKMNTFDPDAEVSGKRKIASHYYPLIGPYDSADPDVIEYHLLLMKIAGIDGVIIDWYGVGDLFDYPAVHRNTVSLIAAASRLGLKAAVCYEDQTVTHRVEAGKITAAQKVQAASTDLAWLKANLFGQPQSLRLNGKDVLLSFGESGLTDAEWQAALTDLGAGVAYYSEHRKRPGAAGAFDWPTPDQGVKTTRKFIEDARSQGIANSIACVYPRFDDVYKEGGAGNGYAKIADDSGATLRTTLGTALDSGAPVVQIATWNDWGEGTGIEPTVEFGYRDLEIVQEALSKIRPDGRYRPAGLRLAERLYRMRKRMGTDAESRLKLDLVAKQIAGGEFDKAGAALTNIERATSAQQPGKPER